MAPRRSLLAGALLAGLLQVAAGTALAAPTHETAAAANKPSPAAALHARYSRELRPLLKRALTNDTLFRRALTGAAGWWKQAASRKFKAREFEAERTELKTLLPKIADNAMAKAMRRCVEQHDLTEIGRMFDIEDLVETTSPFAITLSPTAKEGRSKCGRFELDMDFSVVWNLNQPLEGGSNTLHGELVVRAKAPLLPLAAPAGGAPPAGRGALEVSTWRWDGETSVAGHSCTTSALPAHPTDPLGAILAVERFVGGKPTFVTVFIEAGAIELPVRVVCDGEERPAGQQPDYAAAFHALYPVESAGTSPVRSWKYLGGAIWATSGPVVKEVQAGGLTTKTTASFVLRHTPQG